MGSEAWTGYGKLILALAVPVLGFFFLGMTGFVPLLIASQGTAGGLAIIAYCAVVGSLLCWFGRRSGLILLIGLMPIGFAVWCSIRRISAAG
jgi:hypothetical protein